MVIHTSLLLKMPSKKYKKSRHGKKIKLHKGTLRKFGYSSKKSSLSRRNALCKAVKKIGYPVVSKKLTILQTLNKNRNPSLSNIFKKDREAAKHC